MLTHYKTVVLMIKLLRQPESDRCRRVTVGVALKKETTAYLEETMDI